MLFFLVARMIYSDGLSAIFAFGGIYGTAVFGWGALELGLFGIILTATGMVGAVIGGFLDDRAGAKTVILVSLVLLLIGALGILSVDKTHVLFTLEVPQKAAGSAPFSSIGEQVFLAFAMLVGLVAAPVQAASRSLLARLAPARPDHPVLRPVRLLRQSDGLPRTLSRRDRHARHGQPATRHVRDRPVPRGRHASHAAGTGAASPLKVNGKSFALDKLAKEPVRPQRALTVM